MRILFLADLPRDPHSGAAGTEVRTVEALKRLGHEVDEVWREDLPHRIRHWNLHYAVELPRAMRDEVAKCLGRDYDAVHANQPHAWRAAKLWRAAKQRGVFVHRSHGFELHVDEVRRRWLREEERPLLRRAASAALAPLVARNAVQIARWADGHIVSASLDADFLHERLRVPRERIAVIPQGLSAEYLATPAPPPDAARLRRVLYVGQYAPIKAPEVVAAAMRALDGYERTWVCAREHHETVRALLGSAEVELLDWMPAAELVRVYDRHGVFLFPSYFEGFGKAFLEAMSRGLVVVATDVGGMRDLIEDGVNGFLIAPGDAEALAARARQASAEMGARAAETAKAHTWDRVARETVAFYERLAER
jgi:glycosyltransferase involved in cell wall biosynthesis